MTSTKLDVDWTDDVWRQAFQNFGRATSLTIQLFGPDAQPLTEPLHQSALFSFFTGIDDGLLERCMARCLPAPTSEPTAIIESCNGISVCGVAIQREGNVCAVAVAGYALTAYPSQLSVRRLSTRTGRTFAELWSVLRRTVPMSLDRLILYGNLLRTLGESILAEHMSAKMLADALRNAETASRAKDEFLAMLSHELRNPLSAVRNALATAELDEAHRGQAFQIARRQTTQLTHLVDDLLDVARITHGHIALRNECVWLSQIVERALEATRGLVDDRGHSLAVSLEAVPVEVDPARIEQVVVNILTNAVKYTPPGGRIAVAIERNGDSALIRIRDSGLGLSEEMLPRVFDLFAQANRAPDRAAGGLGIGLTLAKRLVELHGGRIEVRSEGEGRGTEFIVHIPAASRIPTEAAPDQVVPLPGRPARIVLVEDNPDAAESVALFLQMVGHDVRIAHNGIEALEATETDVPDLMLIDIGLPGIDGYEVARRIRARPALRRAVLMALTGYGQSEDRERALAAGFDGYLVKPVEPNELLELATRLAKRDGDSDQATVH
jgi:signal transduction histidine kinase/ActR/RegA family two-component response regulator